jgi:hypothetical protein
MVVMMIDWHPTGRLRWAPITAKEVEEGLGLTLYQDRDEWLVLQQEWKEQFESPLGGVVYFQTEWRDVPVDSL